MIYCSLFNHLSSFAGLLYSSLFGSELLLLYCIVMNIDEANSVKNADSAPLPGEYRIIDYELFNYYSIEYNN